MYQAPVHIVNIRLQQFCAPLFRDNLIVSYRHRNQATKPFLQNDLIASTSDLNPTVTLQTHGNNKTVILDQVPANYQSPTANSPHNSPPSSHRYGLSCDKDTNNL